MIMPVSLMTFGQAKTDPSKRLIPELGYNYEVSGSRSARSYGIEPGEYPSAR